MEADHTELAARGPDSATTDDSQERQTDKVRGWLREAAETLLLAALIWGAVNITTARFVVEGGSMEPNLHSGEFVIVSRVAYWKVFGQPQRGDVVVFHPPTGTDEEFIKRIVGLPGDMVEVREGHVYINGAELEEPYIGVPTASGGVWTIGEDEYFVMGDNRNDSQDSRSWGHQQLSPDMLVGKAWLIYWPPRDWGLVPHQTYAAVPSHAAALVQVTPLVPTLTDVAPTVLEGAGGGPTITAAPVEEATVQEPPTLSPGWVGGLVVVGGTGGAGLAVREGPGLSYGARFVAQEGETYVVEGGPREQDGYTWWYVVDPNSRENAGWAAQNYLERG